MKKMRAFLPFIIVLALCSCRQTSPYKDTDIFINSANEAFETDVFSAANAELIKKGGETVCFLKADGYDNVCVTLYPDAETGVLIKYNVVFSCRKADTDPLFIKNITAAITSSNKYIRKKEFESDGFYIIKYEDKRFIKETGDPVLKKNINEADLY